MAYSLQVGSVRWVTKAHVPVHHAAQPAPRGILTSLFTYLRRAPTVGFSLKGLDQYLCSHRNYIRFALRYQTSGSTNLFRQSATSRLPSTNFNHRLHSILLSVSLLAPSPSFNHSHGYGA